MEKAPRASSANEEDALTDNSSVAEAPQSRETSAIIPEDFPEALAKKMAKSRAENLNIPTEPIEDTPPKKSHKLLWIILVVLFVALAGGSVAYYFLIYNNPVYCAHSILLSAPCPASSEPTESVATQEPAKTVKPAEELPKNLFSSFRRRTQVRSRRFRAHFLRANSQRR